MRATFAVSVALGILFGASSSVAAMLIPIAPVQGSTYTSVTGINDSNIIVGSYGTADGAQHGFFGSLDGQYTSFDAGRLWTQSGDINNAGYIVGATVKGAFERYPDGSIHILKFEHAPLVGEAYGINGKGVFVGTGFDNDGGRHAFYAKSAKYKGEVEIPGQSGVEPRGINDAGAIVGHYSTHGFLLKNDVVNVIDDPDPDAAYTFLRDINKEETIVGSWLDENLDFGHPFVFDAKNSTFTPIDVPNSMDGVASGINSAGLIAVATDVGSFIYCPFSKKSGKCPAGGEEIAVPKPIHVAPSKFLRNASTRRASMTFDRERPAP